MATTPPPAPGSAPPAKKKSNVVLWVIVGVFAFFLLIGMVIVGGMFFIWNKVQDVTNDMEGNPALAITKLITTINPDLEVVSVDEANNTIKIRQKSSNKTIELDLNEINQGNLSAVFEGDEGSETVDLKTDNTGSIEVKTKDKTLKIGSSGEIPAWVPKQSGVTPKSVVSTRSGKEFRGAFTYASDQSAEEILEFYKEQATQAGLEIKSESTTTAAGQKMATLVAKGGGKSLQIFFAQGNVSVTYTEEGQ